MLTCDGLRVGTTHSKAFTTVSACGVGWVSLGKGNSAVHAESFGEPTVQAVHNFSIEG